MIVPTLVILCGGKGTRLREQTEFIPKPLVKIGDMPILWHIMKYYSGFGVKRFILCLGDKGDMIKRFFIEYRWNHSDIILKFRDNSIKSRDRTEDWEIIFAETGSNANSGSRIKQIEKYIEDDNFYMTYGDGLADVDIDRLYKFHLRHGKIATVTTVRPRTRFGCLDIQGTAVTKFEKKEMSNRGWIDGGFFVFKKTIFNHLKANDENMLERDCLPYLAEKKQFHAFKHKGFWQCMDTQKEVDILNNLMKKNQVPVSQKK